MQSLNVKHLSTIKGGADSAGSNARGGDTGGSDRRRDSTTLGL